MSLELRLLPVDPLREGGTWGNCHTILNAPQDYDMFHQIKYVAKPKELPPGGSFYSHLAARTAEGEPTYGKLDRDSYGELYTWARADVLAPILWKYYPAHPVSQYVVSLPGDTMIVFDWH